MMPESFEMERGPEGWRRKEPEPEPVSMILMWSSSAATGLIRVVICPGCKSLVLEADFRAHERWHRDV